MRVTEPIAAALRSSTGAKKCHSCGCFQDAVATLEGTSLAAPFEPVLRDARATFAERKYDCLGCATCWPADALNAAGALVELPAGAGCPVDVAVPRDGWPPLPGTYTVVRPSARVAVCTLHSLDLATALAAAGPGGLAIVGPMQTENLGIERLIENVVANPAIRRLVLCGADTAGKVGHFPGQSLLALVEGGVDDEQRIVGAKGKRPVLKNVSAEAIARFREQVVVVDRRGIEDVAALCRTIEDEAAAAPSPVDGAPVVPAGVAAVPARPPPELVLDPAGYVVVYPDRARGRLVAEHYENRGVLRNVVEGERAVDVMATLLAEGCCTRLDHAAYLGRELALAEASLRGLVPYVQDRAPEPTSETSPATAPVGAASSCEPGCGCEVPASAPPRSTMKYRAVVAIAVLLALGGTVLAKQAFQAPASAAPPVVASAPSDVAAPSAAATVHLFADLREDDEACGCGDVIRAARAVNGRGGVAEVEHDARAAQDDQAKFGVKVLPTVLIVGSDGHEVGRFEGEDEETVAKLEAALDALGPAAR